MIRVVFLTFPLINVPWLSDEIPEVTFKKYLQQLTYVYLIIFPNIKKQAKFHTVSLETLNALICRSLARSIVGQSYIIGTSSFLRRV